MRFQILKYFLLICDEGFDDVALYRTGNRIRQNITPRLKVTCSGIFHIALGGDIDLCFPTILDEAEFP